MAVFINIGAQVFKIFAKLGIMTIRFDQAVFLAHQLGKGFACCRKSQAHLARGNPQPQLFGVGKMLVKGAFIYAQQANERVAGQNVKVDIGQWFKLIDGVGAGDQSQKQAQPRNFGGLAHNIDTKQVIGDDTFFYKVIEAFVFSAGVF